MHISELEEVNVEAPPEAEEGIYVVDIYTNWCGPCKFVSPLLMKLRDEGLISLTKVDLDQNRPLGEKFGVTAIPTLLFFKNGELIDKTISVDGRDFIQNGKMVGAAPEDVLRKIIDKI
ncbi:MAG: thioredoxin family protein [Promethearchaeia archaeon]